MRDVLRADQYLLVYLDVDNRYVDCAHFLLPVFDWESFHARFEAWFVEASPSPSCTTAKTFYRILTVAERSGSYPWKTKSV